MPMGPARATGQCPVCATRTIADNAKETTRRVGRVELLTDDAHPPVEHASFSNTLTREREARSPGPRAPKRQ